MNKILYLAIVCFAAMIASCKVEKVKPATEQSKDLTGSWKVIKAVRNGTDISSFNGIDLSKFRLTFNADNTYALVDQLPFLVTQAGKFGFDDPTYPLQITFTPTGSTAVSIPFSYPIINGARSIEVKFKPGCASNTYIYTFQKAN